MSQQKIKKTMQIETTQCELKYFLANHKNIDDRLQEYENTTFLKLKLKTIQLKQIKLFNEFLNVQYDCQ